MTAPTEPARGDDAAPLDVVVCAAEPPEWLASLRGAPGVAPRLVVVRPGGAPAGLDAAAGAACLLLDTASLAVPSVARRLHEADPAAQVVAVVEPGGRAALERALLYAPGVGEIWLAAPGEVGPDLVARAADLTRRRRHFERTRERIAQHAQSPAPPARRAMVSEAFLSGLLRVLPDPVFSADEQGRVLSANEAGERLAAAAGRSLQDASVWALLAPPAPLASDAEATYDAHVDLTAGARATFEVRAAPVRAVAERAWLVVARDVTERLETQRQLEDQAAELESQASELEVQQSELEAQALELEARAEAAERTRAEADAANAAKSQFLATMSHELRTPLNAILGYAQLLELQLGGTLSDQHRDYVARLRTSGAHLLALINDVLDLSKVDAGGMTMREEHASSSEVAQAALTVTLPLAEQRGIEVSSACEGPDAYVGDADRVRQVLVNLLSNAVKFTAAGGRVAIVCGTRDEADAGTHLSGGGPWAFVRVSDTGVGIAPEQQAAVFDPFYQVDSGHTRQAGGTGLGLAISRRLARLMGGDLTLESAPGAGSTFTLWLPAPADAGDGAETPAARATRARRQSARHQALGLGELGLALREDLEAIIEAVVARVRAEPLFANVRGLSRSDLEDHTLAFIADIAQSLVIVEQQGGFESRLFEDGMSIGRHLAALHGAQRRRLGWSEPQLAREYAIVEGELTDRIERLGSASLADGALATSIVARLIAHARMASVVAYREEATPDGAPGTGAGASA